MNYAAPLLVGEVYRRGPSVGEYDRMWERARDGRRCGAGDVRSVRYALVRSGHDVALRSGRDPRATRTSQQTWPTDPLRAHICNHW